MQLSIPHSDHAICTECDDNCLTGAGVHILHGLLAFRTGNALLADQKFEFSFIGDDDIGKS
ncbi:hypothetical protein D3C80_1999360 [compost metagenome]